MFTRGKKNMVAEEVVYKLDDFELKVNLLSFIPHKRCMVVRVDQEDGSREFIYNFTTTGLVSEKRLKRLFNSNDECRKLGKITRVYEQCPFKFEVKTFTQLSFNGCEFSYYVESLKDKHSSSGVFCPPRAVRN